MILVVLIIVLCAVAYFAPLLHSPLLVLLGIAALAGYVFAMHRILHKIIKLRPRTVAAGIAAPFVFAVLFYLFYHAEAGPYLAGTAALLTAFSVAFLIAGE